VTRLEGSMVKVEEKKTQKVKKVKGQQPKNVDCDIMLS
jgi:hypothetical protein